MLSDEEYIKLQKEREEHMKANVVKTDMGEELVAKMTDSGVELVKVGGNNKHTNEPIEEEIIEEEKPKKKVIEQPIINPTIDMSIILIL